MAVYNQRRNPYDDVTTTMPTFPNSGGSINPTIPNMMDNNDMYDVDMRMNQLYKPETSSSDFFNQLLRNYPTRTEPGNLQKIGFMLASMSDLGHPERSKEALDLQDRITEGPFRDKLVDWKNQIGPAEQAASVERLNNANLRQQANQIISQELSEKRLERQIAADKTREKQGEERINQGNQRLTLAEKRLEIAKAVANGGTIKMDRSTGQGKIIYRDGTSKDVDLNDIPQEDLIELQQRNALERITTAAENRPGARDRITKEYRINPTTGQLELGSFNLDTGKFTPATADEDTTPPPGKAVVEPGVKGETEKAKALTARAHSIADANPDWKPYIKFDKQGRYTGIAQPSTWVPGRPDPMVYQQIQRAISNQGKQSQSQPSAGNTQAIKLGSKRPDGKTYVRRKADGQTGWVTNPDPARYEVK